MIGQSNGVLNPGDAENRARFGLPSAGEVSKRPQVGEWEPSMKRSSTLSDARVLWSVSDLTSCCEKSTSGYEVYVEDFGDRHFRSIGRTAAVGVFQVCTRDREVNTLQAARDEKGNGQGDRMT